MSYQSIKIVFSIALWLISLPLPSHARSCDDLFSYQETYRLDLSAKSLEEIVAIHSEVVKLRTDDSIPERLGWTVYQNQLEQLQSALVKISTSQRLAYLRDKIDDLPHDLLLSLFGINVRKVNDAIEARIGEDNGQSIYGNEILYLRGAGVWESPTWLLMHMLRNKMKPQPGQTVMDLGSGFGALGMLIGLFYPEVKFIGYEILPERVDEANRAALANGFTNVEFRTANLAELPALPIADHIYMYSPFNGETGNKVGLMLRDLGDIHNIVVYITLGFDSPSFYKHFKRISRTGQKIYVRRQTRRL